jgi:hypothetical protein
MLVHALALFDVTLREGARRKMHSLGVPAQAAGDKAEKKKAKLVGQIIELLTVHTCLENEVMYPEVRALLPGLEDDVLESYEEHHVADILCTELAGMSPDAERFDAKTATHHIEEEEDECPPGAGRAQP